MLLTNNCKISKVLNAVVAGTSNQTSSEIDMQGFDGVLFIAHLGTLTSTQVTALEAIGSNVSGSEAAFTVDHVTSPAADADSNKILVLDCFRPPARYLKAVVKRGTANAVINSVIAIQYKLDKRPIQTDASVSQLAQFADGAAALAAAFTTYAN